MCGLLECRGHFQIVKMFVSKISIGGCHLDHDRDQIHLLFFALVESDLRSDLIAVLNRTAMDGLNTKMYLVSQMSTDTPRTLFSSMERQGNGLFNMLNRTLFK